MQSARYPPNGRHSSCALQCAEASHYLFSREPIAAGGSGLSGKPPLLRSPFTAERIHQSRPGCCTIHWLLANLTWLQPRNHFTSISDQHFSRRDLKLVHSIFQVTHVDCERHFLYPE